jgi:hypothetical protein
VVGFEKLAARVLNQDLQDFEDFTNVFVAIAY